MRWFSIAVGVLLPVVAMAAETLDTPETRQAAAERYAKTSDIPKLLRDMVEGMAPNLPPDERRGFRSLMLKNVRTETVEAAMIVAMKRHFTTAEINALAD